jgi:hypothetical protein
MTIIIPYKKIIKSAIFINFAFYVAVNHSSLHALVTDMANEY